MGAQRTQGPSPALVWTRHLESKCSLMRTLRGGYYPTLQMSALRLGGTGDGQGVSPRIRPRSMLEDPAESFSRERNGNTPLNHPHSVVFDYLSSGTYRERMLCFGFMSTSPHLSSFVHPQTHSQWRPEITPANPRDHIRERAASRLHKPKDRRNHQCPGPGRCPWDPRITVALICVLASDAILRAWRTEIGGFFLGIGWYNPIPSFYRWGN